MGKVIDISNQRFGRLVAIEPTNERQNSSIVWKCQCDCGNIHYISAGLLRAGRCKSCGCLQKEKAAEHCKSMIKDITNQRFGKLVALYCYPRKNGKHTIWHCKCDCGNECDIDLASLTSGDTKSCGCLVSINEENIIKLLKENNIDFQYQYKFNDLIQKRFDFFVNSRYIIEYDGVQHFKFVNAGWNNKNNFENTRKSDLEKNKYCFENNIPIIRIPYNKEYNINDLKLETTRFLLTPQNKEEYYYAN